MADSAFITPSDTTSPLPSILMLTSEFTPFCRTGGLGDATASLAVELKRRGHDIRVIVPRYKQIEKQLFSLRIVHSPMGVWMGTKREWCSVLHTMGHGDVPVYFIEHTGYFDRWGLYHSETMQDYFDNAFRFGFFCRAALQYCIDTDFIPRILHVNDWQTALGPAFQKIWFQHDRRFRATAAVLTIHNIAHQGIYHSEVLPYLGIGNTYFTSDILEDHGKINLLKAGIFFADVVTTVSKGYANEVIQPFGGFGLAPYLAAKKDRFIGIINGIDDSVWSPSSDELIPSRYSLGSMSGKKICKRHLQKRLNLEVSSGIPIVASIGRLVPQKGYHLVARIIQEALSSMTFQFVILGAGEQYLEQFYAMLPQLFPGRAGTVIGFDDRLAHLIEAGADFFLMPSIFEPCGLNQMYSQIYGTLPIVHATGGLVDTVDNYDEQNGSGTGFVFFDATAEAVRNTLEWVISTWYNRPQHIRRMKQTAMGRDFSWRKSADEYVSAYALAYRNDA